MKPAACRREPPTAEAELTTSNRFSPPPEARKRPHVRGRAEQPKQLQPFEVKAVVAKTVLCVEAQAEIQDALRKGLTSWGYRALLVSDAETAAERFRESPVDAVIFDTDGQGSRIDRSVPRHA